MLYAGCKDFFESPLPDYEVGFQPKLYIFSVISPNLKNTTVEVKSNKPIVGNNASRNNGFVIDAKVGIIQSKDTTWLWYDNVNTVYRVSSDTLVIKPNMNYKLIVSTPNGLMAQAECTVPDTLLKLEDIKLSFTTTKQEIGDSSYYAQLSFKNLIGEQDYYDVIYEEINYYASGPSLNVSYSWGIFQGKNNLGNLLSTKSNLYTPQYLFKKTLRLGYITLLLTDENYYRYHQTIKDFQRAKENPFAEDSPVYSNVKGGLGVFAAFTQRRILL